MTTAIAEPRHSPPDLASPELRPAFDACRQIVRKRARNFYYGLRVIPEPRRSAVYSIYAWMRYADDLTDDSADTASKLRKLMQFEQETDRVLAAGPSQAAQLPQGIMWRAFHATVCAFPIDHNDLRMMVRGLKADLEHERRLEAGEQVPKPTYPTRNELDEYCYCVASTVGRICVCIWGVRQPELLHQGLELAVRRGRGFQLTNILRDYAEDFDEGRIYLPREDFQTFGLTPWELRHWSKPEQCARVVTSIARWAREEYEASSKLESMIDTECAPALWTMTQIYSGLLQVIEQDPSRIVGARRIRLQSIHKAGIAIRAIMRSRKTW